MVHCQKDADLLKKSVLVYCRKNSGPALMNMLSLCADVISIIPAKQLRTSY